LFPILTSGQTILLSDSGNSYNNTDTITIDSYGPVNISGCTSVEFSIDYSSSLPWTGSGNMESLAECGSCNGQPFAQAGCNNCWDFFLVEFVLDGIVVSSEMIGAGNNVPNATFTLNECTNGASNASINVYTQTWAANESISFTNIEISCLEPGSINDPGQICESDVLVLNADFVDSSYITSVIWGSDGNAVIDNTNQIPTSATSVSNLEYFTLTTTDIHGCSASDSFTALVNNEADAGEDVTLNLFQNSEPIDLLSQLGNPDPNGIWNEGNGIFDPSTDSPGTYTYTVRGGICPDAISEITINVSSVEESFIEMPNVFSPNLDGLNDKFIPVQFTGINEASLSIINRWGRTIIEDLDPLIGWAGKPFPAGVYYWIINYKDANNSENSMTGYVTLVE
jgi:gliding motility-associated-like protein